jgi:ABC-type siderophore export system fused ATPase/permease subunit
MCPPHQGGSGRGRGTEDGGHRMTDGGAVVQSCWIRYRYVWYGVNVACTIFLLLVLMAQPLYIYLNIFPRLNCSSS